MTKTLRLLLAITLLVPGIVYAQSAGSASDIAAADLLISGSGLGLETVTATTGIDIPVTLQTTFGGLKNDQAPVVPDLTAVGDLTGPGLDAPIRLQTAPGHTFSVPGLHAAGTYTLDNVRLMRGNTLVQQAVPSRATIVVADVLQTKVTVKQLTIDQLRARGISVDLRNFDVYEYTFSFFIGDKLVEIPFPVMIDVHTHQVQAIDKGHPFQIPIPQHNEITPRWTPPSIVPLELIPDVDIPENDAEDPLRKEPAPNRPRIPAAIVIPNNFGVLHQFFAVALNVTNGAPSGSSIVLDSVTATMKNPAELRVAESKPAVPFGRPVPITDPNTGATFLIAQSKGEADWTLEGLKTGTHQFQIDVNATYKTSADDPGIPLRASIGQTIIVNDPRFNVTFSHPDVVRANITYSTYAFVTNTTTVTQTVRMNSNLPSCAQSGASVCRVQEDYDSYPACDSATKTGDVCRVSDPAFPDALEVTLRPGATRAIQYKLRTLNTGYVFATAGSAEGDVINAAVQLTMGVSPTGIPLSPATLVMPHYADYVDPQFVSDNLQLLGLGYSLATAPVTQATAAFPRVIKTDVFTRALDIARAGQRIFLGEDKRDTFANLALDLAGNGSTLSEWDELRRREYTGRVAGASLARQIEATSLATAADVDGYLDRFASATAHRDPYLVVMTDGAPIAGSQRPYALTVRGVTTHGELDVPNEMATELATGTRTLPWSDLSSIQSVDKSRTGELAMVGNWKEPYEVVVTPRAGSSFSLELLYPGTPSPSVQHLRFDVSNASGKPLDLIVDPAAAVPTLHEIGGNAVYTAVAKSIGPAPLTIVGARQDMFADDGGRKVSVLFNRPVAVADGVALRDRFHGTVIFQQGSVNYSGSRGVDAAALQPDGRIVDLTFDHSLSKNATYKLAVQPLLDPITNGSATFSDATPVIDNDRPASIIYGKVLLGDNTPVPAADVTLDSGPLYGVRQYDVSNDKGEFLFEYVLRDPTQQTPSPGSYAMAAISGGRQTKVAGAVRLPGLVEVVNLQFLGRGSAEGVVKYDNGEIAVRARVSVANSMFDEQYGAVTGADGKFHVDGLPVGPITFAAVDDAGNTVFAATELSNPGQTLHQDLTIIRKPFPGTGTVRGVILRSDNHQPAAGAHVGVYSQGFGLVDGVTDAQGRFEFTKIPAGLVTVLGADWTISRKSIGIDFELSADETKELSLDLEIVDPAQPVGTLEGDVLIEDAAFPGDDTHYKPVPGALVKVGDLRTVTADSNGHFVYPDIPLLLSGSPIRVVDPVSRRSTFTKLITLTTAGPNTMRMLIKLSDAFGTGTVRVRVLDAAGRPVSGVRVIEPGYPPTKFADVGGGAYQLTGVRVGVSIDAWAIAGASRDATYGFQTAHGATPSIAFDGQTVFLVLRLPGQGKISVSLATKGPDQTVPIKAIGDVQVAFDAWDEAEQGLRPTAIFGSTRDPQTGLAGYAVFDKVPAGQVHTASALLAGFGYDARSGQIAFDGQVMAPYDLLARTLASISGTVYAIDGRTPVPNAGIRMTDGAQLQGPLPSALDGTFKFANVAGGASFEVTAETTQNGIYRVARAEGFTPADGGPVRGLALVLQQQGSVEGHIVYSGYKVFNPTDSSKNVIDDTPNDLTDNAPVPLAQFYLRELTYPYRAFGSAKEPLTADINGHFQLNNIFAGPLRLTAWSPNEQEIRGDWQGELHQEGETVSAYAAIGTGGVGSVVVTVVNPNQQNSPVANAEVALSGYDFGTTDASGMIRFEQLPPGRYSVGVFSKALGKAGAVDAVDVVANGVAAVTVPLQFSGEVNGTLTDPMKANAPVPGIGVILRGSGYTQIASSSLAGLYHFGGIRTGNFSLFATDPDSGRQAQATGQLSEANPSPTVDLQLERTTNLYVKVVYPNDDGSPSNTEVPDSRVNVAQRSIHRTLQGDSTSLVFTGLFQTGTFVCQVEEMGGQQRTAEVATQYPAGSTAAAPLTITLPAYGTVEVTVLQPDAQGNPAPAAGATVSIGRQLVSTDANGVAVLHNIPLHKVMYAEATSFDQNFSAYSDAIQVTSQSQTAKVTVHLGSYSGVSGIVEAEEGVHQPSVGTRVIANFEGKIVEVLTDANGAYRFQGIPVRASGPTPIILQYITKDDATVGGQQTASVTLANARQIVALPTIKLDGTAPQVLSVFPADNSTNVAPDTTCKIVFSERLNDSSINLGHFILLAGDGSGPVPTAISTVANGDGTFTVTLTPPPPTDAQKAAGQKFPLKSNMLYQLILGEGIADVIGNRMSQRGFNFITADYVAPKVLKISPLTSVPVSASTVFTVNFNKPLDVNAFAAGTSTVKLLQISKLGPDAAVIKEITGTHYFDTNNTQLSFAPDTRLDEQSFYRLLLTGVRDAIGNVADPISYDYFSFNSIKPYVTINALVPAGYPLISGVGYTIAPDIRDAGPTGAPSTDIGRLDVFKVENGNATLIASITKPPFQYAFAAPNVTTTGSKLTLRVVATDTSFNVSDVTPQSEVTWDLAPNLPPQNVKLTLLTAAPIYANGHVSARASFTDEGTLVTLQAQLTGKKSDGTDYAGTRIAARATRNSVGDPWTIDPPTFELDLPADLQDGSTATITITAADGVNTTVTGEPATFTVAADANAPEVSSLTVSPASPYHKGDAYRITAVAKDLESGVADVTFAFDNTSVKVKVADATPGDEPHSYRFTTPPITVPAKNDDTVISIVATAHDQKGNHSSKASEVTYVGVHDNTLPRGAWVAPLANAAWPANESFHTTLRLSATDDVAVTRVRFIVPGIADPMDVVTPTSGTVYEKEITVTTPAAGTPFTVTAIVSDANSDHDQTIAIPIRIVAVDSEFGPTFTQAITPQNVASFANKSILLRGPDAHLVLHVPVTLANLILLDGAVLETLPTTTHLEQRVNLTVAGTLYVDSRSSIDVSGKGYLGGWGVNQDGTNTRNEDSRGMTVGNTANGGPTVTAAASYGGLGGEVQPGATNAIYGSITDPTDLGTGGASTTACCPAGGSGGGAVSIAGSTLADDLGSIVIGGAIRADGDPGQARAGSGGSVRIRGKNVVLGPLALVTANGADDALRNLDVVAGGGGGRVSIAASEHLDLDPKQLEAHGGTGNGGFTRDPNVPDGGAGTIYIQRPGATLGELYVTSFDSRNPSSSRLAISTPLSGTLAFDAISVGPRALARFDSAYTVADPAKVTVDPTGVLLQPDDVPTITATTVPVAGASVVQGTSVALTYTAASKAGVGNVHVLFSPNPEATDKFNFPLTVTPAQETLAVAANAPLGDATLKLHVNDRSGRSAETSVRHYTIVADAPPSITKFDTTPSQLYAGHTIRVDAAAADDIAVRDLTLTSSAGTVTASDPVADPATHTLSRSFTVDAPAQTAAGSVTLTLSATDNNNAHAATTQSKSVTILADTNAPAVTITSPPAGSTYDVSSLVTIPIRATASDAEVGLSQVYATIGGGAPIAMTPDPSVTNGWKVDAGVPSISETQPVSKSVIVFAKDFSNNIGQSAATPITINPVFDPNGPTVALLCPGPGAVLPAGGSAKVRISATPATPDNGVSTVNVYVGDSTTPVAGSSIGSNLYEAAITVPAVADGTPVALRIVVTTIRNNSSTINSSFTAIAGGTTISSNTTIAANDTTYENQTVIVRGATVTVSGQHLFGRLLLLDGAKVVHPATTDVNNPSRVSITAQLLYVSCDSSIDATSLGFAPNATYPGATPAADGSGGSHMGKGGLYNTPLASTFGSVYRPQEAGGGAGTCCGNASTGGGIIQLTAGTLALDGSIKANGGRDDRSAAGGSVWITAGKVSGSGSIEANGGDGYYGTGAGGAVAIEYTDATSVLPVLRAKSGETYGQSRFGGAGTIYVKGPQSTYGDLTVDNHGLSGQVTELPSLGSGHAAAGTGGATLVTDRGTDIPPYFAGNWVEISSAAGTLKGTWRIASVSARSVTLAPNGSESISVQPGDLWQGVYRFDNIHLNGGAKLVSSDPLRTGSTFAVNGADLTAAIAAPNVTVAGNVTASQITATTMTVQGGATLRQAGADPLTLNVSGALNVLGSIDVKGQGFAPNVSYPGAALPGDASGGSHLGKGGLYNNPLGATYGSVYRPHEAGSGAGACCGNASNGGGVVQITAGAVNVDGSIKADGGRDDRSGAGGSVWIATGRITGAGTIEANGGDGYYGTGAGGAVAVEYTDPASVLPTLRAKSGETYGQSRFGGAGTVYVKGPQSSYGDLTVDNRGLAGQVTELPSLGSGHAIAGTSSATLVTDRSSDIPAYFAGNWVEISSATGTLKGTWRIVSISARSVTLAPNAGESINLQPGDAWQGVYRFDNVSVLGAAKLTSSDPIRANATSFQGPASLLSPLSATTVTIAAGSVSAAQINATNMTIQNGATLGAATSNPLAINVSGTLNVQGSIDVSNQGFAPNGTDPSATAPGDASGGSHLGKGGLYNNPLGSTFGSVYRPRELGGGAGACCGNASNGGGALQITAGAVNVDGSIKADGGRDDRSGAGGSVWIATGRITGAGTIEANGGDAYYGIGGGGAVALEYTDPASVLPTLRAKSGETYGQSRFGGAGTVYVKGPQSVYGDLSIDNRGLAGQATELPSFGSGRAIAGTSGATLVTDRSMDVPPYFAGNWVEVSAADGTVKGTWRIASVSARSVTLAPNGSESINLQPGDLWAGVYRFDHLTLRSATLITGDRLVVTATIDKDSSSTILGNNQGAPVLTASLISLQSNAGGSAVTGAAGAVSDPDTPITLTALNTTKGSSFTGQAAADGSFNIPVQGDAGDVIALKARDGNLFPRESATTTVGTLSSSTATATQIDRSAITSDTSFFPRAARLDGSTLVLGAYRYDCCSVGSDKLAILDVADPSRPAVRRYVQAAQGAIWDYAVQNGWAYVVADRFSTLNLNDPNSAPVFTTDACGREVAVAVAGGYAFTAMLDCNNDGRVIVYDVSNPAAPRYIREQGMAGYGNFAYNSLIAYGSSWLIGVSDGAGGTHDVTVIDRRDINNLVKVTEIDIPDFAASFGRLEGDKLYVVDGGKAQAAIVSLADPRNPQLLGRLALPGIGRESAVSQNDWFLAASGSGLVTATVADPARPAVTGATTTGGNAFDVVLFKGYAYVPNEIGLAVIPLATAPRVDASRIQLTPNGTMVAVTGSALAITGQTPLTVEVADSTTGATVSSIAVAADGSFNAALPASPGDTITVKATDGANRIGGPVVVGTVPFGATPHVTPVTVPGEAFRARLVRVEGNTAVVSGFFESDKVEILDVTNPAAPVVRRIVGVTSRITNLWLENGWAYITGDRFATLNVNDPNAAPNYPGDACGRDEALLVSGGYAFTSMADCNNDGRIIIYDVSNPAAPRYLREQGMAGFGGYAFTGIYPLGTDYLACVSSWEPSGNQSPDVMIIDRRDVNNLRKVSQLVIPEINGWRGRVVGNMLYVAGTAGGEAIVDLSDPANPRTVSVRPENGFGRGVDMAGSLMAVAAGGEGVNFYDTTGNTLRRIGTQPTGGVAFDAFFSGSVLYVANEQGLVTIDHLGTPPRLNPNLITITSNGSSTATIHGNAGAVDGQSPVTIEIADATSGAAASPVTAAADGSFTAVITATGGDVLTIKATDTLGHVTGPTRIGSVPFGVAAHSLPIVLANDGSFHARNVRVEGNLAVLSDFLGSDKLAVVDVSNPASPQLLRNLGVVGRVANFALKDGWAYVVGDRFATLNVADPNANPNYTNDACGREEAVTVAGGYAFTSMADCNNDGRIIVYDVTNPATPRYLTEKGIAGFGGYAFTHLLPYGSDYLIGISSWEPSGSQTPDVMVIDRRDPGNLQKVSQLVIPEIAAWRGRLVGNLLYVAGTGGGEAIVDLTDPANPRTLSVRTEDGFGRGVTMAGSVLAVAKGGDGIGFYDTTGNTLRPIGQQPTGGVAWDADFAGSAMFVANEQGLVVFDNVALPPRVEPSRITIAGGNPATIRGSLGAVLGQGSVTAEIRNTNSGASVQTAVAADGTFTATLAAAAGDAMTIKATDALGRVTGPQAIGTVPFGTAVHVTPVVLANDGSFRARNVRVEGNTAVLAGFLESDKIVVVDVTDPTAPRVGRSVGMVGRVTALALQNGWAYVVGDRFATLHVTDPSSSPNYSSDACGREEAIAVSGNYAFTTMADCNNDGRIVTYDVTNPAQPVYVTEKGLAGFGGYAFTNLLTYGANYLVGISSWEPSGNQTPDVMIIDRRDPANLVKVSQLVIPEISAWHGRISGNLLYLGGVNGGEAIVDLTDVANPRTVAVRAEAGFVRGVQLSGSSMAVAEGTSGVVFYDTTGNTLHRIGAQLTGGTAWDIDFAGTTMYVATELGLVTVDNAGSGGTQQPSTPPPAVAASKITITALTPSSARVTGAAGALTGQATLTYELANGTTVVTGSPSADGSFTNTIAATAGQSLTLKLTDGVNRNTGAVAIGNVPALAAIHIDTAKLTLTGDAVSTATVTGLAGAVSGSGAISVELRNDSKSTVTSPITAASDGSFTAVIAAAAGDRISVKITDASTQTAGPTVIGNVPFGTNVRTITIQQSQADATFRARTLATDGATLVVAGYANGGTGDSPKLLQYDLSTPGNPHYTQTLTPGSGAISGVALTGGYALVASTAFSSVALSPANAAPFVATGGSGNATAVAVSGTYAFVASDAGPDGRLRIYDITDPSKPRFLSEKATLAANTVAYRALIPFGSDYLVALTPDKNSGTGHDVVVLDRRDVDNIQAVADLDIAEVDAFRGTIVGSMLYVAGQDGGTAVVDLSNPKAPSKRLIASLGTARGIALAGTTAAVADGTAGITFLNTSSGAPSTLTGSQSIGSYPAWDVAYSRGQLYVADEGALVVVENAALAPSIDPARMSLSAPASGQTTLTAQTNAVAGHAPVALEVQGSAATLNADGSFTATVAAKSGDAISVKATDAAGRASTRIAGIVPFSTATLTRTAGPAEANDTAFAARRLAVDSTYIAVTTGSITGSNGGSTSLTGSGKLLLFVRPDTTASPALQSIAAADDGVEDVALDGNWAFTASATLSAIDLGVVPPIVHQLGGTPGRDLALAIAGTTGYAAVDGKKGTVRTYDLTTRSAPAFVRDADVLAGVNFRKLLVLDANNLVAITPDKTGATGHDVVVLDRASLTVKADVDVPNFDAIDGALDGTTLFLAGGDSGIVAVDLSSPASPQVKPVLDTPGVARGLAVSRPNELVVADGTTLTFIDTSDRNHLLLLGSERVPGNAVDVKASGNFVWAATEQQLHQINR